MRDPNAEAWVSQQYHGRSDYSYRFLANLTQPRVIWEEDPQFRKCLYLIDVGGPKSRRPYHS